MSEAARIELLKRVLGAPPQGVGIGDDAAVLEGDLVWTVDAQIEGTHFRRAWLSWEDVGYRSVMAAASDLAAMGAKPLGILSALALDPSVDVAALQQIARGQAEAARELGTHVLGGNMARARETSITTTLLGQARRPLLRSGAKPGDGVFVVGALGLAGAAVRMLLQGHQLQGARFAAALQAFRRPRARIEEGLLAAQAGASAAVDVSDGLACDLARIAEASNVTITLDGTAIASRERVSLDLALYGGEDYALVVTASAIVALDQRFTQIGTVVAKKNAPLFLSYEGTTRVLDPRGYDHFVG